MKRSDVAIAVVGSVEGMARRSVVVVGLLVREHVIGMNGSYMVVEVTAVVTVVVVVVLWQEG